jgi:hypothetical protein
MKNKLTDLNNHLFIQLERLNDESLTGKQLEFEAERTKNVTSVAKSIISNAQLALNAELAIAEIPEQKKMPEMLQ